MLTCHEASRLLSDRQDRRLGIAERLGLWLHVAMCRGCSRAGRQLGFMRKAMRELGRRGGENESTRD